MTMRPHRIGLTIIAFALVVAGAILLGARQDDAGRGGQAFLPEGLQVYSIAQAEGVWPRLTEARIDPLDVHVGQDQTIEVAVEARAAVAEVFARVETDKGEITVPLARVGEPEATDGGTRARYRGTWTVHDTHDATYRTTIVARGGGDESSVTLAWTDACGIPAGGNFTLSSPCTISSNDGIDGGSITVNSSLTINANFAINAGQSLTIGSGSVAICNGCSIIQTNIWQVDADADGFPANGTMYVQDTAPTNGRRRNLLSTTVDCNDGAFSSTNTCAAPQCWPDADGDGFFSVNPTTGCSGSFSLSQGNDCYDANASARPNQTSAFGTNRGDGSFDYNCNGVEQKTYTVLGDAGCPCQAVGYSPQIPACGVTTGFFYTGPGAFSDCEGSGRGRCNSQSQQQTCI